MARKSDFRVEISQSVDPFEQEWLLLKSPANATPFQDFEMMRAFYRQLDANSQMKPVIALVRHADGRPVAIFPMMRSRGRGVSWLHTHAGMLDYCAPILDVSLTKADIAAVVDAVLAAVPGVDFLHCSKLPAHFEGRENPLVSLKNAARLRVSAWQIDFSGLTREALAAKAQKRFRSKLSSRTKKLAAEHDRRFAIAFGTEISDVDFADFKELRSHSFGEKGRPDVLSDPDWSGFYESQIGNLGECRPFLATLRADGIMLAGFYGFFDGRRVQVVLPASLMGEWGDYQPGLQVFQETLTYFHQAKISLYDFSIGDMIYKRRFGGEEVGLYETMFPKTLKGALVYQLWRLKVAIRSRMKKPASET